MVTMSNMLTRANLPGLSHNRRQNKNGPQKARAHGLIGGESGTRTPDQRIMIPLL
jgi:hypothetical protein